MNDHIQDLMIRAMKQAWASSDPDGDVDKMYIPAVFAEKFAQLIANDCTGIWEFIDNGNKLNGTSYFPEAVFKQYGIIR